MADDEKKKPAATPAPAPSPAAPDPKPVVNLDNEFRKSQKPEEKK